MIYVFSNCKNIENKTKDMQINRLFAYPTTPQINPDTLMIIDSGGFAMSLKGKTITTQYLKDLSAFYEKYYQDNVMCVAPDRWLDAFETMRLYKKWQKMNLFKNIVPVIQDKIKGVVDVDYMKMQVDFYKSNHKKIMYSNNGIRGDSQMAIKIDNVCKYAKQQGIEYIHLLGAGWSLDDIKAWQQTKYIDSIDSIAYYTAPKDFNAKSALGAMHNIMDLFKGGD